MKTDFCLEDWTVKPQRNRIRRGDEVVHLAPKAMAVLQCLADAGGEVVSRDKLFDAVWPGAVISDDALTQQIVELRKAFGDSAHDPKFIETIPKQGFRLIPSVSALQQKAKAGRVNIVVASLLILTLSVVVADRYWLHLVSEGPPESASVTTSESESQETEAAPEPRTIAVLPFVYLSGDEEGSYLGEGIADTVLHMLAQVPELHVISRTSSFKPQIQGLGISEIAEKLGVATVLEGSVQRQGNQLRITAQLIDAASDDHLWSGNFDRTDKDIFAIQDEVALAVVSAMEIESSEDLKQRIELEGTDNVEAYAAYLQGESLAKHRKRPEAMARFERAVELDPDYAEAHAWIGFLYRLPETAPELNGKEKRQRALQAASRALELAPDLPMALQLLAWLSDDLDTSGELLKRAYENAPNDGEIILAYAEHHLWHDDHELSEVLALKVLILDPLNEQAYWHLTLLRMGGLNRMDGSLEMIKLWKEKFPDSTWALSMEALHHQLRGDNYSAIITLMEAVRLNPDEWFNRWEIGLRYLNVDMPEKARRWWDSIETTPRFRGWLDLITRSLINQHYQRNDEQVFGDSKQLLLDGAQFSRDATLGRYVEYGARLGRLDEVVATFEGLFPEIFSDPPPKKIVKNLQGTYRAIALALLQNGDTERGEPLMRAYLNMQDREDNAADQVHSGSVIGRLALGEREAALEKFRRHAELKWIFPAMYTFRYYSVADPIRNEPEFIALMEYYERNAAEQRRLLEEADFQIP